MSAHDGSVDESESEPDIIALEVEDATTVHWKSSTYASALHLKIHQSNFRLHPNFLSFAV